MSLSGVETSFLRISLVADTTGCRHWLAFNTTKSAVEGFEIGRCPRCHQDVAYALDETGRRTRETKLVSYS